ncbi:MAG: PEP-CTERM sorting domain-containing protein [Kiritimatiellae bacterium]|nr:PEP-CTERM sorting domain-containing protein [Kiritimatiellia bacterium]
MKKYLFAAAILGAMVASAEDSWLYWMVDSESSGASVPEYTTAKVRVVGTDTFLTLYDAWMDPLGGTVAAKSDIEDAQSVDGGLYASLAGVTDVRNASFIIELFNGDSFVGQSATIPYSSSYVYYGAGSTPPAAPTTSSSFAVPEPNSAMLMLIGCAMLGLRRRRQNKA